MGLLCSKIPTQGDNGKERTQSTVSDSSMRLTHSAFVKTNNKRWDDEYEIVKTLGQGITGSVHLVKKKTNEELLYAKKSINVEDQDPAQMKELRNEIDL